jgi:hypothetical protein
MNEDLSKMDPLFLQLILSLQAGAMQQMGKIASPMDGKVERDLKAAQFSIDILDMLDKKMKGNLADEEAKLLGHVLYELRLNYVDEAKKKEPEPKAEKTADQPAAEAPKDDNSDSKTEPEKPDEA